MEVREPQWVAASLGGRSYPVSYGEWMPNVSRRCPLTTDRTSWTSFHAGTLPLALPQSSWFGETLLPEMAEITAPAKALIFCWSLSASKIYRKENQISKWEICAFRTVVLSVVCFTVAS